MTGIQHFNAEQYAQFHQQYRLNESYFQQYMAFLERLLSGNWGVSFINSESIFEQVFKALPATIELAGYALIYSFIVAIPLGVIAANESKPWLDKIIISLSMIGFSMPIFWLALLMIMLFSLHLSWFPLSGRLSLIYDIPLDSGFILYDIFASDYAYKWEAVLDALRHLAMPTFILAAYPTNIMIRTTRQSMKDVMNQPYIKAAKAKGLTGWGLLKRHSLRNGILPVFQMMGRHFGTLITLAMVTEVIFSWPGIGYWLVDAIHQRDYPAIQGGLMVLSSLVFITTILFDLVYIMFDPLAKRLGYGKI